MLLLHCSVVTCNCVQMTFEQFNRKPSGARFAWNKCILTPWCPAMSEGKSVYSFSEWQHSKADRKAFFQCVLLAASGRPPSHSWRALCCFYVSLCSRLILRNENKDAHMWTVSPQRRSCCCAQLYMQKVMKAVVCEKWKVSQYSHLITFGPCTLQDCPHTIATFAYTVCVCMHELKATCGVLFTFSASYIGALYL